MITMITHMRVRRQNARAFEAELAEMSRKVKAAEPGAVHYELFKSTDEPDTYAVIEMYRDQAAVEAHRNTAHLRAAIANTASLVEEGRFDIKHYASP